MSWFKQSLTKFAQTGQLQQTSPQSYYSIGDAGNPDILNPDCEVFVWVWTGSGINVEEVIDADSDHDNLFPGMSRDNMYYGRFSSCQGRASVAKPRRAMYQETPEALIRAVASRFAKYNIQEIWEFGDSRPRLLWPS